MLKIKTILIEVFSYLPFAWAYARSSKKVIYREHRFGMVWEYLNPLIQMAIWGLVFGLLRSRSGVVVGGNHVPFIPWMLLGMTTWGFMNGAIARAGGSVRKKKHLFSKLKFPLSVFPAISIANRLSSYFVLLTISIVVILLSGIFPNVHWLAFFYYLIAMLLFVYFFALFNSNIILRFPDYQNILKPIMRLFFFFSGPVWRIDNMQEIPNWFVRLMDLTPFSYIITGLRHTFFANSVFRENWLITTIAFWIVTLILAIIGTHYHFKLRSEIE